MGFLPAAMSSQSSQRKLLRLTAFYVLLFFLATLVFDTVTLGIGVAAAFFALQYFYQRGLHKKQL